MKYLQRSLCALILVALMTGLTPLLAQDAAVKGAGSGVVLPLFQQIADASGAGVSLDLTTNGTAAGLKAFCAGEVTIAGATRTITAEEENACKSNNITYQELLVAHHILTFIGNPADDFLTCVNSTDIDTIFTPASAGRILTWKQVKDNYLETPLSLLIPTTDTLTYEQLDTLVKGDGIRSDAKSLDTASIVDAVGATPGAIGVVDLKAAQAAAGLVKIINVNSTAAGGCTPPDASTSEDKSYEAADQLYLYVNTAQAAALNPVLTFMVTEPAQTVILNAGYTPITASALQSNVRSVSGELTGRVFSREDVEFKVPENLAGQVNIGGSGAVFDYFKGVADSMTGGTDPNAQAAGANLAINFKMEGDTAGMRRLCNGEVDLVILSSALTDDQKAACTANNILLVTLPVGTQAVVLLGHAGDTYTECLTRDRLIKIWGAASTGVKNWKDVDASLPDQAMTLFGIDAGSPLSDILLENGANPIQPVRVDTELSPDALYRAAAVANVEGALTYMSWSEYQRVIANAQERIQIVNIDGGSGCVEPTLDTIKDGSYPLTQTSQIVISQKALARIEVESYVWSLFLNSNYVSLASQGLIGPDINTLSDQRVALQAEFDKASVAAAQAAAETTPEAESTADANATTEPAATAEATEAAATTEPTAEATVEATAAATAEATEAATAEPTTAVTAEATANATAEATTAATSEATSEATEASGS